MKTFKMIVLTNPVEGREAEYNDWYSSKHIYDVLKIPGITSAQRFRFRDGSGRWGFLALYDLETDNPEAIIPEIRKRSGDGTFLMSDAIRFDDLYSGIFEPITERATAPVR